MGRKPRQEELKDYLENPRTTWLFSSPHQFYECFGDSDFKYLTPAGKGVRLGKDTFRIVLHFPNKHHNDRDNYIAKVKDGHQFGRFFNTPLGYSRIRWDSGSHPSAQLILHDKKGRRQEFYLTGQTNNPQGAAVFATTSFPTMSKKWKPLKANTKAKDAVKDKDGNMGKWIKSEKLVLCPVRVGSLNVSASKPGKWKLSLEKPTIECGKGVSKQGSSPMEFMKKDKPKKPTQVKLAETTETKNMMSAEEITAFYEAQGLPNLLEIQDVEIMNSETGQQAIEREYYNPSEAMVGTTETLDGYRPIDSATVDLTSNQPTANYGAEGSKRMMCADCGSKKVMYAEGETATYSPSEDPDMVSSSSFDNPTNANYSAEGEPIAVAEGTSLNGYAPIDSIEEGAPIGHGVTQFFGSAEGTEEALLDESTTGIGIEEGTSLDGYSGVDSVAVEAPLGHGVTQWYAEDSPEPQFDEDITGQDGPSADPTNANFSAQGYNDRMDESLGMRHRGSHSQSMKDRRDEASAMDKGHSMMGRKYDDVETMDAQGYNDRMDESLGMRHRGSHSQSMKDRRDEASAMDIDHSMMGRKYDDVETMDAEINRWHDKQSGQFTGKWSKHRGNGEFKTHNAETAGYLEDGSLSMNGYTPLESVEVDRTSFQPTQNYGADYEGEEGILGDSPTSYAAKGAFGLGLGTLLFGASLAAIASVGSMLVGKKDE